MLQPVRTKWRKAHKGRIHGNASRANFINYGAYALKALSPDRVTGKQIEAARVALTRHMKRQGRVWTRIFPNIPVSKKPIEVRMGKGKGSPEFYACRVKPGRILFEVDGVSEGIAKEALYKASAKLPIKTKRILKDTGVSNEKISNMINVYNKIDVSKSKFNFNQNRIFISALTGEGIDNLKDRIKKEIIKIH